ncbi:MAG TPA: class I SAM-dependent methyltransferase [Dehalococcoidia bacterium]|nr:class I SAM-dependent methyltransferase [Dehalococcoidia bacterium]
MSARSPGDAVRRWQELVDRRRRQIEAASAAAGLAREDYWAGRAAQYARSIREIDRDDPFVGLVLQRVTPDSTVLDVGAGTGRHAVRLARVARRVVAIDPSRAMLSFLREEAERMGLRNIDIVEGAWPEVDAPPADVAICSHVLYPIYDIVPFLRKLDASATWCFVYLRVDPIVTDLGLWQEFHGEPLVDQPTHADALDVIHELGIAPNVTVFRLDARRSFASWDEAVEQALRSVCVPDTPENRSRLAELLRTRLREDEDGMVRTPPQTIRTAVLWWGPDQRPVDEATPRIV